MSHGDDASPGGAAIRRATLVDLPAIRELTRSAYAVYLGRMGAVPAPVRQDYEAEAAAGQIWVVGPTGPAPPRTGPAMAGSAAIGPGKSVPANAGQESLTSDIAGVIVLIEVGNSLLIENVAVSPAAQGAGLGRRLMEFAEQEARARGLRRMTLYTNEVMTENLAIYARLGYRETSRGEQDGYRRVFMEKSLA